MADTYIVFHNPRCSKSRAVLKLLEEQAVTPEIVNYLNSPPNVETLKHIHKLLAGDVRDMIRSNEGPYQENGLDNPDLSDDRLFQAIEDNPILLQRPLVIKNWEVAKIGRPPEAVLALLS